MKRRLALLAAGVLAAGVYAWPAPAGAGNNTTLVEHDYVLNCAACHLLAGQGSATVPSLADTGRLLGLPGGREYLARVPGVAQSPLDDGRLAAVLNWILPRFGGVTPEPAYTADEISRLRVRPYLDPLGARRRLTAEGRADHR